MGASVEKGGERASSLLARLWLWLYSGTKHHRTSLPSPDDLLYSTLPSSQAAVTSPPPCPFDSWDGNALVLLAPGFLALSPWSPYSSHTLA